MVMRLNWKLLVRYLTTALVIFVLFGNISQACHTHNETKCSNETEKMQITDKEENDKDATDSQKMNLLKTTWFTAFLSFFEKLLERYPILKEVLQMIFS